MNGSDGTPAAAAGELTLGDMTVRRLGYGAMRITGEGIWGEPEDRDGAIAVLRRAVELDVNFIDTADSYGPDVSEELIAEALHPYPEDLVIATKGGLTRAGPGQLAARLPPGAPEEVLRGQPAAAEARHDRPLPAAHARPEGAVRGVGRRAVRAARRGQGPARRPLQRRAQPHRHGAARSSRSSRSRTATASPRATRRRC